jgi:crotonobetainyl-CoA:carnitine CoA-transferase CaiB-like acyl-CoA transferase
MPNFFRDGEVRERIGNRNPTFSPAGTFETKDGKYVQIAAGGDNVFQRLVEAIGMPELAEDDRYSTSRERISRADELEALLADWVGLQMFADIDKRFADANVPFGGIYTAEDISQDPHYAARKNLATVTDEAEGDIVMPAVIPKLSETPGRITHAGPAIGAYNEEIYGELLGKSAEELAALKDDGVI